MSPERLLQRFSVAVIIFNLKPLSTFRILENSSPIPKPYPWVPSTEQFCRCTVNGIKFCFGEEVFGWCICFRQSLKFLPRKTVNSELTSVIPLWFRQYLVKFFKVHDYSYNHFIYQTINFIFIINCNVS